MTSKEFIYWLKGFIDYQQLQEQKNPAFTRIKDELMKVSDFSNEQSIFNFGTKDINGNPFTIPCATGSIGVINTGQSGTSTATYKTDSPVTYTTKQKSTVSSYL